MATYYDNLRTRRTAIAAELAAIDTTKAGGKPNASGVGESVDHVGYKTALYAELESINKELANEPYEIETEIL